MPTQVLLPRSANQKAAGLAQVVRHMMLSRSLFMAARDAERRDPTSATTSYLKAAVVASTTGNAAALVHPVAQDFLSALASAGLFDGLVASSKQLPFNAAIAVTAAGASASVVGEGVPKPLQALSFSLPTLTPSKVVALVALSKELARSDTAVAIITAALRGAVASATDAAALAVLVAGAGSVAASGTSAANFLTDLRAAVALIPTATGSRLVAGASPAQMKRLALLATADGELAFPDLDVTGGTLAGITFTTSDALTNSIVVADASQLATNAGAIEVRQSEQATLQMDSAPDNPTAATSIMRSLFQSDQVAVLVERTFAAAKLRANAAAQITGANYG